MPEEIRSFVAIELPEELKSHLAEIQRILKRQTGSAPIRWVDVNGIHLTLKFLGNVPAGQIEAVGAALARACAGVAPFALSVGGLGCFPNFNRPNVVWVGVGGDMAVLERLHAQIEAQIAPLGYPTEKREFRPHLTLGRVRHAAPAEARRIGEIVRAVNLGTGVTEWRVGEVVLMRSDLSPAGAKYTRLKSVSFG